MQRVIKDRGAAGKALLDNEAVLPQLLLQKAGPALGLIKAVAVVTAVIGVGAVAVGVGIPEADNMFFHGSALPEI